MGRSIYLLVRTRAGLTWLVLVAATLLLFLVGVEHRTSAVVLLAISAIKVRLIGLDFMELRCAPTALRVIFESYCAVLWAALSGLYLWL